MTITAETTSGLARFHKSLPVADLVASAKGLFGVSEKLITDVVATLHKERAYFQDHYLDADREIAKIETVVCLLPEFDGDGPGDCGDRIVAAIIKLRDKARNLESFASTVQAPTATPVVLTGDATVIPAPQA